MKSGSSRLEMLFHHRWSVPVLAQLYVARGAKFVTLSQKLGVTPGALRITLESLISHGWVMRNPGYGHPLRPEYILTPSGRTVGKKCSELLGVIISESILRVALTKWSLQIVTAMADGNSRFSELQKSLAKITDRALTISLKEMQSAGLLKREIIEGYPPTTSYRLTKSADKLVPILKSF